ncbi:MAG: carboxypeptidase-like regulatory domain-containing protein, partial [Myxococcaceae bacterium]|nr:carboxypeptidase-like regulatory domain-containing protein [Myxococcaceae bacterium]
MRKTRALWVVLGALGLAVVGLLLVSGARRDDVVSRPVPTTPPSVQQEPTRPSSVADAPTTPPLRLLPATRAEDSSARNGAFEGRVVSASTGEPVRGAELTFAAPSGASSVRTGEDGAFRFVPDAPGVYQLAVVTAQGFLPFGPEWGQSPIHLTASPG